MLVAESRQPGRQSNSDRWLARITTPVGAQKRAAMRYVRGCFCLAPLTSRLRYCKLRLARGKFDRRGRRLDRLSQIQILARACFRMWHGEQRGAAVAEKAWETSRFVVIVGVRSCRCRWRS